MGPQGEEELMKLMIIVIHLFYLENTCLYIGNIDKRIDGEQLTQIFAKFGTLEYCYLVYEPSSSDRNSKEIKISRGYGFAKYVKIDDLMKAKT